VNKARLILIVVVVALVVMPVNPFLAQFSTAARSHHSQSLMTKRSSDSSDGSSNDKSSSTPSHSSSAIQSNTNSNTNGNGKVVIINFDDSHQSDYTYAKPILDKYGFKATFFEVCNWVEAGYHDKDISITWPEIAALQQHGMDIESHTMTHPILNDLSQSDLNYEIGQSKQCLENHGFNPTIFAYPNGDGPDDSKVVNTVAKYYDLARTDTKSSALALLPCGGDGTNVNNQQQRTYCETYLNDGEVIPESKYSINSWAHKHIEETCPDNSNEADGCTSVVRYKYNNAQMFQKFITAANNQIDYNKME
jgi:peptidoglycan/xylan/chitin deacetylase (PgdA/CDA1 family)